MQLCIKDAYSVYIARIRKDLLELKMHNPKLFIKVCEEMIADMGNNCFQRMFGKFINSHTYNVVDYPLSQPRKHQIFSEDSIQWVEENYG